MNGKTLYDENGVLFAPITHIDCVLDDAGNPISEKLNTRSGDDIPRSLGVLYCLKKAQDLIKISQYIQSSLPVPGDNKVAGDTLLGMPYSSTRKTNTFVPNATSYETYQSALADPESFAYTINPNLGSSGALYYGTVCIMFCQYCLGIDVPRHRNISVFGIPGIEQVEVQDVQSMQLGYVINTAKNGLTHCMICTGITRENGIITSIRMSESTEPVCREVEYTPSRFNNLLSDYTILRYTKIDENTYKQFSQSELAILNNKNVQTKKGTRSLWGIEEDVILDIVSRGNYTHYKLMKNGVVSATEELPENDILNLGPLGYGKYSLCLTDGENDSQFVEWIVVDYNVTAESEVGGIINVTFSSENATPIGIAWSNSNYMFQIVKEVSEADVISGSMATSLDKDTIWANHDVDGYAGDTEYDLHKNTFVDGTAVYVRMMFRTEFGIYTTPMPSPVYYKE